MLNYFVLFSVFVDWNNRNYASELFNVLNWVATSNDGNNVIAN